MNNFGCLQIPYMSLLLRLKPNYSETFSPYDCRHPLRKPFAMCLISPTNCAVLRIQTWLYATIRGIWLLEESCFSYTLRKHRDAGDKSMIFT